MEKRLKLMFGLATSGLALALSFPAIGADAPPQKAEPVENKAAASAQAPAEKKRAVTPHNHMRDAKGVWVPEKQPAKAKAASSDSATKAAADDPAKK